MRSWQKAECAHSRICSQQNMLKAECARSRTEDYIHILVATLTHAKQFALHKYLQTTCRHADINPRFVGAQLYQKSIQVPVETVYSVSSRSTASDCQISSFFTVECAHVRVWSTFFRNFARLPCRISALHNLHKQNPSSPV